MGLSLLSHDLTEKSTFTAGTFWILFFPLTTAPASLLLTRKAPLLSTLTSSQPVEDSRLSSRSLPLALPAAEPSSRQVVRLEERAVSVVFPPILSSDLPTFSFCYSPQPTDLR
jgi:hypothetical protein